MDKFFGFINKFKIFPSQETEREKAYREYYTDPEIKEITDKGERA